MEGMRKVMHRIVVAGAIVLGTCGVAAAADPTLTPDMLVERIGTAVLAVGALGTAAFGVVDTLKLIPAIDLAGFQRLFSPTAARNVERPATTASATANLDPLLPALAFAYGRHVVDVLKAQYRGGRKTDLPRTLRQGVRIGLGLMEATEVAAMARFLGLPEATATKIGDALDKARKLSPATATTLDDAERAAMARLETAIDARIDAALMLAENVYVTKTKLLASVVAIGIALVVGFVLNATTLTSLIVGIAAVPLAPVAHDLATAIEKAAKALRPGTAR